MQTTEILRLQNITKAFNDNYTLRNFSLLVNSTDKINIVGPSGIGKSTLLKLILGYTMPDSGSLYYLQNLYTTATVHQLRKNVGYVSQDLQLGTGTVQSFFTYNFSLQNNKNLQQQAQSKLPTYLALFDLTPDILTKDLNDLSGGEKQRIAIINVILLERNFLLLDEFTAALDKDLKKKVVNYFYEQPNTYTIINITHDTYLYDNLPVRTIDLSTYKS